MWSVEGGAWDIVYVKKTKHACMGRVQAFRTPWSRRRCPARRGCVCSREKLTMLRWYFIQCIKPACSCSNKVCCTSKGATAKKKTRRMYEHSHLKKKKAKKKTTYVRTFASKKKKSAHHGREFLISGASSRVMLVSNVFPMTEALLSK